MSCCGSASTVKTGFSLERLFEDLESLGFLVLRNRILFCLCFLRQQRVGPEAVSVQDGGDRGLQVPLPGELRLLSPACLRSRAASSPALTHPCLQDAMRAVTKQAVREARLKEIKQELLNSEKLKV